MKKANLKTAIYFETGPPPGGFPFPLFFSWPFDL